MVIPNITDSEAENLFGAENIYRIEVPSKKNYLRHVKLNSGS